MPVQELIRDIDMRTKGLHFKKLDLHVHTGASRCYGDDRETCAKDIVKAALAQDMAGIAITDHNTSAGIDAVREAAKGTSLTVFPGVELTVGDAGVHIIAILPADTPVQRVDALMQRLHLKGEAGSEHAYIDSTVENAINCITGEDFNGLAVLAHADSSNGVFDEMNGAPRIGIVRNWRLLASEAKDVVRQRKFLNGKDPNYLRKLAIYQASDNPHPQKDGHHSAAGTGSRFSYFKVDDELSLESLRQCFIDPDVRIRQPDEYKPGESPRVISIKVESGMFDGEEIEFHPGLNCILGAKGAGKSMLIEFLRFALDQPSTIRSILQDHKEKLEKRLGLYGLVTVTFIDDTGKEYTITRKYDPSQVDQIESIDYVRTEKVIPVMFLSQNEVVKIAEDEAEQLRFIDRFFDISYYKEKITEIENELGRWDQDLAECITAYKRSKQIDEALAKLKEREDALAKQLSNNVFADFRAAEEKNGEIIRHYNYATSLVTRLQDEVKEWAQVQLPGLSPQMKDKPELQRIVKTLSDLITGIAIAREGIVDSANKASAAIFKEYNDWKPKFQKIKEEYEAYVRTSGGNEKDLESERRKIVGDAVRLRAERDKLQPRASRFSQVHKDRDQKLSELFAVYRECYDERVARCRKFVDNSAGRLDIVVHESSNVEAFREELMALKRGSRLSETEITSLCSNVKPKETVWAIIAYDAGQPSQLEKLADKSGLAIARLKALADHLLEKYEIPDLLSLQYKAVPEDRPEIWIVRPDDSSRSLLKHASAGQKCTAVMLMALCEESIPVVIDQPEDSLDNRTVWNDVCTKLRRNKEHRQFILATHNSSLAVASDTDKYIILEESDATRAHVALSGAVDVPAIKDSVIEYLEGGLPTYRHKYAKYALQGD